MVTVSAIRNALKYGEVMQGPGINRTISMKSSTLNSRVASQRSHRNSRARYRYVYENGERERERDTQINILIP